MKKIAVSLILIIAIIANCTKVFAERFESLGMNIDLPKEYYNLKAGIETGDSKIEYYTALMQTTKEKLSEEYKQNSILYDGINTNMANEIYISSTENKLTKSIFHLSSATEEQITQVEEELKKTFDAQEMKTSNIEKYEKDEITYIYSVTTKSTTTIYQYYTVVNGVGIAISLHSSDSSAKSEEIKKMIDSISFDELQEKPAEFTLYILIGVTAILVIMVLVLMYMAFFSQKKDNNSLDKE